MSLPVLGVYVYFLVLATGTSLTSTAASNRPALITTSPELDPAILRGRQAMAPDTCGIPSEAGRKMTISLLLSDRH